MTWSDNNDECRKLSDTEPLNPVHEMHRITYTVMREGEGLGSGHTDRATWLMQLETLQVTTQTVTEPEFFPTKSDPWLLHPVNSPGRSKTL